MFFKWTSRAAPWWENICLCTWTSNAAKYTAEKVLLIMGEALKPRRVSCGNDSCVNRSIDIRAHRFLRPERLSPSQTVDCVPFES